MAWSKDNSVAAKLAAAEALLQAQRAEDGVVSLTSAIAEVDEVVAGNTTRFLPAVATVALRDSTYTAPLNGDTVRVTGTSTTYRYSTVGGWVVTDVYNATAIDNVTAQLADNTKHTNGWVNVKSFGAVGDGVADDTVAIQNAINAIEEHYVSGIGGLTYTAKSLKLIFPKGTYRITNTLTIQKVHKIDFGEAILNMDTISDIFMFDTLSYKAVYLGGVFAGKKIFDVYNPNEDQGLIIFKGLEFKGSIIAIQAETQSSKCIISECKFDKVIHPLIQIKCDDMNFNNNWCASNKPTQNNYGNIVVQAGRLTIKDNILIPLNAENISVTESAWIDFSGTWLVSSNNRFSGEAGNRCPVNWKTEAVIGSGIIQNGLSFKDNLVAFNSINKTSTIRLYKFPNHMYVKHNYYGVLMDYVISFTVSGITSLETQLTTLKNEFFNVNTAVSGVFSTDKFERFSYDIKENNFYLDQTVSSDFDYLERQTEWYFLSHKYKTNLLYMRPIQAYTINTENRRAQDITSLQDAYTSGDRIIKIPLGGKFDDFSMSPLKISCSWNRIYNGTWNHQVQELLAFHLRTYVSGVVSHKVIYKNLIENVYDGDVPSLQVEFGMYDTNGMTYFDGTLPTSPKGMCLKFKGASIDKCSIKISV